MLLLGRLPLYGELVWAKLGGCRWWPSIIVPPFEVPARVQIVKHKKHDFCIRFFGSNDYSWISRGFVFLYQEGDSDFKVDRSIKDNAYQKALNQIKEWFEYHKTINAKYENTLQDKFLKPHPYTKITKNRAVAPVKLFDNADEKEQKCECSLEDEEPCGPNAGCLNRSLMYECHPNFCPAGELCQNQRFEKRLYPRLAEKRMPGKGWGLVTLVDIKAGTFIIEYVGEIINQNEFQRRLRKMQEVKDEHYYFCTLRSGLMIDAGPKGNSARFINHSCEPNCETQLWQVMGNTRVGLFALEDIPAVSK